MCIRNIRSGSDPRRLRSGSPADPLPGSLRLTRHRWARPAQWRGADRGSSSPPRAGALLPSPRGGASPLPAWRGGTFPPSPRGPAAGELFPPHHRALARGLAPLPLCAKATHTWWYVYSQQVWAWSTPTPRRLRRSSPARRFPARLSASGPAQAGPAGHAIAAPPPSSRSQAGPAARDLSVDEAGARVASAAAG